MSSREPSRRARSVLLVVLVLLGAGLIGAALGFRVVADWALPTTSSAGPTSSVDQGAGTPALPRRLEGTGLPPGGGLTVDDGLVPEGVTVLDDDLPAVARLDPALLRALRAASAAAGDDGIELVVASGWRSPAYQDQLLREAVAEHGSAEEAARWVATAETSAHVFGDAVDIGGADAQEWLSEHGAEHGLCRIYDNEPWHVELRAGADEEGCPEPYADPTEDPRLRD